MEITRFVFWTAMKVLTLAFLGLLASKAVGGLRVQGPPEQSRRLTWVRGALYGVTLILVALGALAVGNDLAAAIYAWTSSRDLAQSQVAKAYSNAVRAVELRPSVLSYWQVLAGAKFAQGQFASVAADMPALQALNGGELAEEDAYRLATSYYFLGQYDKVIALTQRLIAENHVYAAPYVLQGYAYTAQMKLPEAERSFLEILQMFPTQQAAVEGLAHVYFLKGNAAGALGVLAETAKYPFPPEARRRFEALKALYAQ